MRSRHIKVTVCVSSYNHERYIDQCINSILNQSFQDFELLVIDDGSQDSTPLKLKRLSQEHGFFFQSRENKGLPATLNELLVNARGEYVTLCASDDYWPSNRLSEQVQALDENEEVDIVHGLRQAVDQRGKILSKQDGLKFEFLLDGPEAHRDLIARRKTFAMPTVMARRQVFDAGGRFDEQIAVEDFDWMLRAAKKHRVKSFPNKWVYYRQHESNWSATAHGHKKIVRANLQVASKLPFFDAVVFIYMRVPSWFAKEVSLGLNRAYAYLLLFPFLFWNRLYISSSARLIFGNKVKARLKELGPLS